VVGKACRFAHRVEELQEAMVVQRARAPVAEHPAAKRTGNLWELRGGANGANEVVPESRMPRHQLSQSADQQPPLKFVPDPPQVHAPQQSPEMRARVARAMPVSIAALLEIPPMDEAKAVSKVDAQMSAKAIQQSESAVGPAHVVQNKVVIAIDDNDSDLPPSIPALAVEQTKAHCGYIQALDAKVALTSGSRRQHSNPSEMSLMPRVVVDIEDFSTIDDWLSVYGS